MKQKNKTKSYKQFLIPAVIFVVILAGTFFAWQEVKKTIQDELSFRFSEATRDTIHTFEDHLSRAEQTLFNLRAFFHASEEVTRGEWNNYVEEARSFSETPGLFAVSYAERQQLDGGQEIYRIIYDSTAREVEGREVIGITPADVPEGERLLEQVLASQELFVIDDQEALRLPEPGFALVLPVYESQTEAGDIKGFLIAAFLSHDFFAEITKAFSESVDVEIYNKDGSEVGSLVYDTHPEKARSFEEHETIYNFHEDVALELANKSWSVHYIALPDFLEQDERYATVAVLVVGGILSFLVFAILFLSYRTRAKAVEIAETMTENLRQSKDKLRSLILNTPDVFWTSDEEGSTPYISEDVERVTGHKQSEFYENPESVWFNNIHENDREKVEQAYQDLFDKGQQFDVEYRYKHKDGSWIWLWDRAVKVYEKNNKKYADGLFADITERKRLEKKEDRLLSILGATPDFVGIADAETGKSVYVNRGGREMLGISEDYDISQLKIPDYVPDEVREKLEQEALPEAVEKGVWAGEIEFLHQKKGKRIPVSQTIMTHYDESGNPEYFSTIARDIRSLKQAEEDLRRRSEELKKANKEIRGEKAKDEAILLSIGEGLVVTDENSKIEFVNEAFEQMLGWEQSEVVGKGLSEVIPMRDKDKKEKIAFEDQILSKVLYSKEQVVSGEIYFFARKDGSTFPVSITVSPIIFDGEVVGAVEVFRDVSHEMEVDKAKTEFVSLASHQLRTPLSTISWYAEMLLDGDVGKLKQEQEDYVREIYQGNQRMVDLVNALLNVSRMEMGTFMVEPEKTDITKLAESVVKGLKKKITDKKLKINTDFDNNIPEMKVDPDLMRIILENLLSNAVKYSEKNGTVEFELSIKKDNLRIRVKDNGIGIPEYQQDEIFTKLFRADNVKEQETDGTGLGLYIVKSILEHSGGKIWFESKQGKGTTFYAELPLSGMKGKKGTKSLSQRKN